MKVKNMLQENPKIVPFEKLPKEDRFKKTLEYYNAPVDRLTPDQWHLTTEKVRALKPPLEEVLAEVFDEIIEGKSQLLIGEDASGRIPTWIVRKVVNGVYEKMGYRSIETRYVAGSRGGATPEKQQAVTEYVEQLQKEIAHLHRALIVTDVISSAKSIKPIIDALKSVGIRCDVLAVTAHRGTQGLSSFHRKFGFDIRVFEGQPGTPFIMGEANLSGVKKYPGELHARSLRRVEKINDDEKRQRDQLIDTARQAANQVAEEILDNFRPYLDK